MAYPSGTPVDEAILDNVVATLAAIATPSYHLTFKRAERFIPLNATQVQEYPSALVGTADITWSDALHFRLSGDMRFTVRALVEDREAHQESLAWAAADVRKALLADVTRGGLAVDTKVLAQSPFMLISEAGNAVTGVDVSVQVRFRHQYDDPNTAA